jgi:hypothetical protein
MKRIKIKKAVSKRAKKVKQLIKTSKQNTDSTSYVEMVFQEGEKTVDSNTLIKKAQARVLNYVKNGVEYPPFVDEN